MEGERKAAGSGAENFRFGTMGNVRSHDLMRPVLACIYTIYMDETVFLEAKRGGK